MIVGSVIDARLSRRAVVLAFVASSFAIVGCGGSDQTTGTMVQEDPEVAKQQDAMREFYKKQPLPKPKKQY